MEWLYPLIWLVLIILFIVMEASTVQLVSIWLAVGSLAALVPAILEMSLAVQVIVFIVVSAVCLVFTRPFVKKVLAVKKVNTNADRTVGEFGLVTETIDNLAETGAVKLDGVIWSARSEAGDRIPTGSVITVKRINRVTVFVERAEKAELTAGTVS